MHTKRLIGFLAAIALTLTGAVPVCAQHTARPPKAGPLYSGDTLTICIMGDMMMHSAQLENAFRSGNRYDFSPYFRLLENDIASADIAVANMEFTLAGPPYTGYPAFSAPDCYAEYLAQCGFDVFLAANNHIFDKGSDGAERTLEQYRGLSERYGIRFTGLAGNQEERDRTTPLIIRKRGIHIALINFTYGTNTGQDRHWPKVNYTGEKTLLKEALGKAEESADICIVLPHWGTEYELVHDTKQESEAAWLAEGGADAIIGTHPHVVQDIGCMKTASGMVPVAYSLGNAISNMSARNTQLGLMATLKVIKAGNGDISIGSIRYRYVWCSRPGGYGNSYMAIPVKDFLDRRDEWQGKWDHDKMVSTYRMTEGLSGPKDDYEYNISDDQTEHQTRSH